MAESPDKYTPNVDVTQLRELLDRHPPIGPPQEGDYAELMDENNPQSDVVVRRKNGTAIMTLPRSVWDDLLRQRKDEE